MTAMTPEQYAEIRARAEAATPTAEQRAAMRETAKRAAFGWGGDWTAQVITEVTGDVTDEEWAMVHAPGKRIMVECEDGDVIRHIAGMDPATTLALLDDLDALQARADAAEAEAARLRAGADESDPEPNAMMTPGQVWSRLLSLPEDERIDGLGRLLNGSDRGSRCFVQNHPGEIEGLRRWSARLATERGDFLIRAEVAEAQVADLTATVARVKALADEWDGYGHGVYNVHPTPGECSVCDVLAAIRAALEGSPTSHTHDTTEETR